MTLDLDRSQPPLFIQVRHRFLFLKIFYLYIDLRLRDIWQMLSRYVTVTGDRSILARALPLAEVRTCAHHI